MTDFCRVLVLSGEPFNWRSATGITLGNLFQDWPPDRLFEVYTADLARDSDFRWPAWRLSSADLALVGRALGRTKGAPAQADASVRARGAKATAKRWLTPWLDLFPYRPPSALLARLDEFRPQVVYSMLGNVRLTRLAGTVAARYGIPVVPHFMDDWPTTYAVPGRSLATIASRSVIGRAVERLMAQAPLGFSIGDAMAREYAERFSRPFVAFMNPVSLAHEVVRDVAPERARLGYIGGLHLSRHANVLQIAHAVGVLKSEGLAVDFSVWAPLGDIAEHGEALMRAGARCGSLAPSEVPAELKRLDIAVHVEAFGKKEAEYTRLSVSTKIPQYFAAAVPIFGYGPPDAASCRYIVDNDCGVCIGRPGVELVDGLRALVNSPEARLRMGANGRRLAAERHDAAVERVRFASELARAVSMGVQA